MNYIKKLFEIEKKPVRGLLAVEWAVVAYTVLTLMVLLFTYTKSVNPEAMVLGRMRVLATILALWVVYRLVPCRLTCAARVITQIVLLAWWYPDTYELNRVFPNLDHVFASLEQSMFGFQPALVFAATFSSPVVSELMSLGYASYYPMIALVVFFYFFCRYEEFERCAFIIMAAFFIYYVVFVFVPVTGPTFYYRAIGIDNVTAGIFPDVQYYFNTHRECLPTPGYTDGTFYAMVESAKAAGERPTAAFPSSHVGVATILMMLAAHSRNKVLFVVLAPLYVLLCLSTVYIQAHYAIDSIAGLVSGFAIYALLFGLTGRMRLKRSRR